MTQTLKTTYPDQARFIGSLYGLILGDIVGAYHEFSAPARRDYPQLNALKHHTNVFGMGFSYTDDTILTLAAMEAFIDTEGVFSEQVQLHHARRYLNNDSPWSPSGTCFDIGLTTRRSLEVGHWPGKTDPSASGNGVLMRLLPFAWHFACVEVPRQYAEIGPKSRLLLNYFDDVTDLTHGSDDTLRTSRAMGNLLTRLLFGMPWADARLCVQDEYPVRRSYGAYDKDKAYRGYCVESLELAIALMDSGQGWQACLSTILSIGGDTDTNAAIFGQLYGACFPNEIRERYAPHKPDIFKADQIDDLIHEFATAIFRNRYDEFSVFYRESHHSRYRHRDGSERDGLSYSLDCPNDCVHYGEGCLLGYLANQHRFAQRPDHRFFSRITQLRSDAFRYQWTRKLGRPARPHAPPCYHNAAEAKPACRWGVCGHLPQTVRAAEERFREAYRKRHFLIDATPVSGLSETRLEKAITRVSQNAITTQRLGGRPQSDEEVVAAVLASVAARVAQGDRPRISFYTPRTSLLTYPWREALMPWQSQLEYFGVWKLSRGRGFYPEHRIITN